MTPHKNPQDCETMAELRLTIDALDTELVTLLARRAACIDRAVVLKKREGLPARIDHRIEIVIQNVRAEAADAGLDPDLIERIWRMLIEWSIRREEEGMGK